MVLDYVEILIKEAENTPISKFFYSSISGIKSPDAQFFVAAGRSADPLNSIANEAFADALAPDVLILRGCE